MSRKEYFALWAFAVSGAFGSCVAYQEARRVDGDASYLRAQVSWLVAQNKEQQDEIDTLRRKLRQ